MIKGKEEKEGGEERRGKERKEEYSTYGTSQTQGRKEGRKL